MWAVGLRVVVLVSQEGLTPEAVGQVRAYPPQTVAAFKTLSIPTSIQKEVR